MLNSTPIAKLAELLSRLKGTKKSGAGWVALCPAHDDSKASLSIDVGEGGRVLVHCHAGCSVDSICAAVGLQTKDLFPAASNGKAAKPRSSSAPQSLPQLSAERLHEAYSLLIERLNISALHGGNLLRRGMPKEQFELRQYRTMPSSSETRAAIAAELAAKLGNDFGSVPGFGFVDGKSVLFGAWGMLVPVRNALGQIIAITIRSDRQTDENKYTALSSKNRKKYDGNSPGSPGHVPLGVMRPLSLVRIVEGHLKADVISTFDDVPTISCGGVSNWRKGIELAKELGANIVRVAFDADAQTEKGKGVAQNLLAFLRALRKEGFSIELERWALADGKGLDDLLAAKKTPEVLVGDDAMAAAVDIAKSAGVDPNVVNAAPTKSNGPATNGEEKKTQATILIELVGDAELFHDLDGEAYARFSAGEGDAKHREVSRVKGAGFRRCLKHRYYRAEKKAPSAQSFQDALGVIEAKALFDGDFRNVDLRVADHEGRIYIDLVNERWQAIEIDRDGWRIIDDPPVMFRRTRAMRAIPLPEPPGDVGMLRRFLNISDEDWPLALAWLVAAMRPTGPYPVLPVYGEQGSAKSTFCKFLRRLIDPNEAELRAEYREARDLAISANNSWVIALDNVSMIPPWLSDCLCRLATGGGFSTRTLYENDEETIFYAKRPVILNCIEEVVTRSDLLDRSVPLHLPRIEDERRVPEKALDPAFAAAVPTIFGGLLSAVSAALRNEASVKLPQLPRMADFAIWATAAEPALGLDPGEFLKAYTANREAGNETAIEASPVGKLLIDFIQDHGAWSGTSTELLAELESKADQKMKALKSWPKTVRTLGAAVKRLAPNLRKAGVGVEFDRKGHKGVRTIILTRQSEQSGNPSSASSATSAPPETPESGDFPADANSDADANDFPDVSTENAAFPKEYDAADATDGADAKFHTRSTDRDWCEV